MCRGFLAVILGLILTGIAPSHAQTIVTYASNATFSNPSAVAVDGSGNIYIASFAGSGGSHASVVKIAPGGTFLESFVPVPGDDPISAIALDASGNLYIADVASNQVFKATPAGVLSTFVDASAGLSIPAGLAVDAAGNLYVSNQGTNSISKVTPVGAVSTFVDGTNNLGRPCGLAFDGNGNLYVANLGSPIYGPPLTEGGNRAFSISLVTPGGVVNNFTNPSYPFTTDVEFDPQNLTVDHAGNLYVTVASGNLTDSPTPVYKITPTGTISRFDQTNFFAARGIGLDPSGNLVIADAAAGTVSRMTPADAVTTVFQSAVAAPVASVFDHSGNLYVANKGNNTISKVTPAGVVSIFVPASAALAKPEALAIDAQGNLYVGNAGPNGANATISKVTPSGAVSTFVGTGQGLNQPQALAFDANGNLFVANTESPSSTILEVSPSGTVSTFIPETAKLGVAGGLAFDASGNLYIADANMILKAGPTGSFSTFASLPGFAEFPEPLAFDTSGNLYVPVFVDDPNPNVGIVKVSPSETLTVAEQNTIGATTPQMGEPTGLVFDSTGRLYVTDPGSNSVLQMSFTPPPLVASILPGSRSVELGTTATVFGTMINATNAPLGECGVEMPVTALGTMTFQTTDPSTNALIGTPNTPVTIPANGVQSFVLAFPAVFAHVQTGLSPVFFCQNVTPAATVPGVDTVDLVFSSTPVADVIALSATPTNDGIIHIKNGVGAFAVATIDAGAAASLTAQTDTNGTSLPISVSMCQTNAQGQCLAPAASTVPVSFAANATPTFSVFVGASGTIPFAPATSRIFVRFEDAGGTSHGSTSVAVTTN